LETCATLVKKRKTWKKCGTLGKRPHALKITANLNKIIPLGKVWYTWKSAPRVKDKCATLEKLHHTLKSTFYLEKCAMLGKMHNSWKEAPHLEKGGALKKKIGTL